MEDSFLILVAWLYLFGMIHVLIFVIMCLNIFVVHGHL